MEGLSLYAAGLVATCALTVDGYTSGDPFRDLRHQAAGLGVGCAVNVVVVDVSKSKGETVSQSFAADTVAGPDDFSATHILTA